MKMDGRNLHGYLENLIPGFDDADLYFDTETTFEVDEETIREQISQGYLSIDDESGHEAYYTELDKDC